MAHIYKYEAHTRNLGGEGGNVTIPTFGRSIQTPIGPRRSSMEDGGRWREGVSEW
jgi:hypothetical protein